MFQMRTLASGLGFQFIVQRSAFIVSLRLVVALLALLLVRLDLARACGGGRRRRFDVVCVDLRRGRLFLAARVWGRRGRQALARGGRKRYLFELRLDDDGG